MTLLAPLATLAIFTLCYAPLLIVTRVRAVRNRDLSPGFFKTLGGADAPDYVLKPTRHWSNLFEVPVLFYAACLAVMALGLEDRTYVLLAWGFVGLRLLQALIHSTYNHVLHRLLVFALGLLAVLAMWLRLALAG